MGTVGEPCQGMSLREQVTATRVSVRGLLREERGESERIKGVFGVGA